MKEMIYVCSPYSGTEEEVKENVKRARDHCRLITQHGCIPIAPHTYFTEFLDDTAPEERQIGIDCGLALLEICGEMHVLGDRVSEGMEKEIRYAEKLKIPILYVGGAASD